MFNAVLRTYRLVFDGLGFEESAREIKKTVLKRIAKTVREEAGVTVTSTTKWFFKVRDLYYASKEDKELLVDYHLGLIQDRFDAETVTRIRGITKHLSPSQVPKLLDRIVIVADRSDWPGEVRTACWEMVTQECLNVKTELLQAFKKRLEYLASWCKTKGLTNHASRISALEVTDDFDPFADE